MQASAASLAAAQAIAEALKAADRGLGVIQQFGPLDGLQRWIGAFEHVSQLIDGSKQIKTSAVKSADVKDNGLTGTDVKDNGLTGADINESTLALPRAGGTVTLAGTSFRPRASSVSVTPIGSAGAVYMSAGSDFLVADVVLPDGATIVKAEAYIRDQSDDNSYIQLVALDPATNTMTSLGSGTTGPSSPVVQVQNLTPSADKAVVDSDRTYQLWYKGMAIDNLLQLFGAKITYS